MSTYTIGHLTEHIYSINIISISGALPRPVRNCFLFTEKQINSCDVQRTGHLIGHNICWNSLCINRAHVVRFRSHGTWFYRGRLLKKVIALNDSRSFVLINTKLARRGHVVFTLGDICGFMPWVTFVICCVWNFTL